ncbi:SdpI family protein [Halorussus sp. MSC15.2]|uniref:SdpI family protein n=1 Tax=Halorussus sp. MSC15.2 TaxID=2283638 RepID=UPI0013D757F0|nr:SdpI family protein [Halorussus sp. MSC15.2]NEU57331.1 SdpI family protein [Halorussus sp. MSC15.2]
MSLRRSHLVGIALVGVSALLSLVAYPEMPAEMATHWNAAGEVDGRTPKLVALAAFPALLAATLAAFAALPRIDPLGENVAEFREQYDTFVALLLGFLAYLHLLVVAANAGYEFGMIRALAPAVGALYYYVGVLSEHAERNWFVGIRTPWTVSSDEVWDRTHERAAPLFKLAGVVAATGALVPAYAELFLAAPVAAVALYATAYSYVEYRRVGA